MGELKEPSNGNPRGDPRLSYPGKAGLLRGRRRTACRVGAGLLVGIGALVGSAGPGFAAGGGATFRPAKLERLGTVTVRDLSAAPSAEHPALHKPFLSPPAPRRFDGAPSQPAPVVDVSQPGGGSPAGATTSRSTTATSATATSIVGGFSAWSSALSQSEYSQNLTPPDTQLAAGPTYLVEMVNDVGSYWSKTGAQSGSFDLNTFFNVPTGQLFSDPRVIYDAPTGRWFATGLSFTSSYGSQIYIAVSATSDPTRGWVVYSGDANSSVLHDQPKIGVSADKVVMAWNDFYAASLFEGSVIWVIQKSDLLNDSASPAVSQYGPDSNRPSIAPVQDLSYSGTDTTAFAVYNDSPYIGVLAITGTPAQSNLNLTESDPSMGTTASPPSADQPGYAGSIDTNDTRFLGAVWQGGTLWTSANDGCGSSQACGRLVAVSTASDTVTFSADLAFSGGSLYYPAVSVDSNGDMFAVYTVSDSTSVYPSVRVIAATAGASGYTLLSGTTVENGVSAYSDGTCLSSGPCRWGDYSGAATDPSDPADVWLTGEYATSGTGSNNWGTFASELSVSGSTTQVPIASVTPSSISFGKHRIGTQSSPATVTVSNTGGAGLSITSITSSDPTDFVLGSGSTPSCYPTGGGVTVAPQSSCTFTVTFQPASATTFDATVTISDNASPSTQTVAVSGTGTRGGKP